MNRPDVLFLLNDLRWGGAEKQVSLLAPALNQLGLLCEVAGLGEAGPAAKALSQSGVPCHVWPMAFPWSGIHRWHYLPRLWGRLRRLRPRLVAAFTQVPNVYGALVSPAAGISRFVWCQRDSGIGRMPAWMEEAAIRRATHFTANAESGREFLSQQYQVEKSRITLLPNAVDPALPPTGTREAVRIQLGCAVQTPVILMTGNFRPPKDHATVIRALSLLSRHRCPQEAELWFAGRHDLTAPAARELVNQLGLTARVRFLGTREDIPDLLAAADVVAHSSDHEGMPNAVLEAMAAGRPVVATDLPGTRTLLSTVAPFLLIPARDPSAFAEALARLIMEPQERIRLGSALREFALGGYALEKVAARWFSYLQQAASG